MKNPVASLPSDRRVDHARALQGAVTRFQAWQRSFQWSAVFQTRRRPQTATRVRTRG